MSRSSFLITWLRRSAENFQVCANCEQFFVTAYEKVLKARFYLEEVLSYNGVLTGGLQDAFQRP